MYKKDQIYIFSETAPIKFLNMYGFGMKMYTFQAITVLLRKAVIGKNFVKL